MGRKLFFGGAFMALCSFTQAQFFKNIKNIPCAEDLPKVITLVNTYTTCVEEADVIDKKVTIICNGPLLDALNGLSYAISRADCREAFIEYARNHFMDADVGCYLNAFTIASICRTEEDKTGEACIQNAKDLAKACTKDVVSELLTEIQPNERRYLMKTGQTWNELASCINEAPTLLNTLDREMWKEVRHDLEKITEIVQYNIDELSKTYDAPVVNLMLWILKGGLTGLYVDDGKKPSHDFGRRAVNNNKVPETMMNKTQKLNYRDFPDLGRCIKEWDAARADVSVMFTTEKSRINLKRLADNLPILGDQSKRLSAETSMQVARLMDATSCLFTWKAKMQLKECRNNFSSAIRAYKTGSNIEVEGRNAKEDEKPKQTLRISLIAFFAIAATIMVASAGYYGVRRYLINKRRSKDSNSRAFLHLDSTSEFQ
eukprot:Ihof_evm31s1 gene=Ihof_evmTU31s1